MKKIFPVLFVLVLLGLFALYAVSQRCRSGTEIAFVGFMEPYLVLSDHGRGKHGLEKQFCLKVIDPSDGRVLLQRPISNKPVAERIIRVDDTLVILLGDKKLLRFDVRTGTYHENDIRSFHERFPEAQTMSLISDLGVIRITDLAGRTYHLNPATLEEAESATITRLQSLLSISRTGSEAPVRVDAKPRSPLYSATGTVILPDVGFVYPQVVSAFFHETDYGAVLLGYDTIEKKDWMLTAMNYEGVQRWQITRDDLSKEDGHFRKSHVKPLYHFSSDQYYSVVFPGRILQVDTMSGSWRIFRTYQ